MVGTITAIYEENGAGDLVVEAVFITATVFILLTIFTLQSKWDFSFLGAGLGVCLWIMILWVSLDDVVRILNAIARTVTHPTCPAKSISFRDSLEPYLVL